MIVSLNTLPNQIEFDQLIKSTVLKLNDVANNNPNELANLFGRNLEPYVHNLMTMLSIGTPFENTIVCISGQKFPDIVANKLYGIEVKTTSQNHWKTTGNSVLENTRVEGVERIYMLFAKLAAPIEFKCRPYEEVLSEVVVTHSPRYLIDMNLEQGQTIFDKVQIPYDTIRKKDNPIKPLIEYYKSKLKPGEELWWMGHESSNNFTITLWNNVDKEKRKEIIAKAMVFFTEIFGKTNAKKYERIPAWLVTREGIVTPSMRDSFSAGGKGKIEIEDTIYDNVPKIFITLLDKKEIIKDVLSKTSPQELKSYWKMETTNDKKLTDWIDLVVKQSKENKGVQHLDIKKMLMDIFLK